MTLRIAAILFCILGPSPCTAETIRFSFFSISVPEGWQNFTHEVVGSVWSKASSSSDYPQLMIESSQALDCSLETARRTYWLRPFSVQPNLTVDTPVLRQYQILEKSYANGVPLWVAATYTCTSNGVIFAISFSGSETEAIKITKEVVGSIHWLTPLAEIETTSRFNKP